MPPQYDRQGGLPHHGRLLHTAGWLEWRMLLVHPLQHWHKKDDASLLESDVPFDSSLEGHLLWDFASSTPGTARNSLSYFILQEESV